MDDYADIIITVKVQPKFNDKVHAVLEDEKTWNRILESMRTHAMILVNEALRQADESLVDKVQFVVDPEKNY